MARGDNPYGRGEEQWGSPCGFAQGGGQDHVCSGADTIQAWVEDQGVGISPTPTPPLSDDFYAIRSLENQNPKNPVSQPGAQPADCEGQ